jgi:hypothetical protein
MRVRHEDEDEAGGVFFCSSVCREGVLIIRYSIVFHRIAPHHITYLIYLHPVFSYVHFSERHK